MVKLDCSDIIYFFFVLKGCYLNLNIKNGKLCFMIPAQYTLLKICEIIKNL